MGRLGLNVVRRRRKSKRRKSYLPETMNKFILISLLACLITMVMIGNEDGVEAGGHYSGSSNGDSRRRRRRTPGLGRRRRTCKTALKSGTQIESKCPADDIAKWAELWQEDGDSE